MGLIKHTVFAGLTLIMLLPASVVQAAPSDDAVTTALVDFYQLDTSIYRIEVMYNRLESETVTSQQVSLQPMSNKEPLGIFSVKATVERDGREVESSQVRFMIRKFIDVLVCNDRVNRHDLLSENQVKVQRMDVTSLVERPLTDFAELNGKRTARNIRKGSIITSAAVEPIPDVEYGHEVTIVYNDGLCRITVPGQALAAGCRGEYIKVKNKASGKIVMAKVVDNSAVAVDP